MTSLDIAVPLIARILLVILFPFSALDKILDWNGALKQANSSFLPGGPVLLIMAIIVEVAAPICIVLAWHDRMAAFVLAGFCVVTALLYHEFWRYGDFWDPVRVKPEPLLGLPEELGLGGRSLDGRFRHPPRTFDDVLTDPLSSTPVYSAGPAPSAGQH